MKHAVSRHSTILKIQATAGKLTFDECLGTWAIFRMMMTTTPMMSSSMNPIIALQHMTSEQILTGTALQHAACNMQLEFDT